MKAALTRRLRPVFFAMRFLDFGVESITGTARGEAGSVSVERYGTRVRVCATEIRIDEEASHLRCEVALADGGEYLVKFVLSVLATVFSERTESKGAEEFSIDHAVRTNEERWIASSRWKLL